MDTKPVLSFPVIRGLQAGREYYVAMWTLRMLRQVSIFDEEDLPPELRAQRTLNKNRIPEISDYVLDNPDNYVFSALTVSIDSEVNFEPFKGQSKLGVLEVPMEARFIVNDGQHRRASIIKALDQRPDLAYESIAVVFFIDIGLERCQQTFSDLNRYAIRPSRSLGILYDHRNDKAKLAKLVVMQSKVFRDIVDMEKSSLAKRSRKLFTLSAFYNACADFIEGRAVGDLVQDAELARDYWDSVAKQFPSWTQVRDGLLLSSEVREGYVHAHGVVLQALAKVGNGLLKKYPNNWKDQLPKLSKIDWSRGNTSLWEGRAMLGGRISKTTNNIILTINAIKSALDLPLSKEEILIEKAFEKGCTK